jgi:hypothetical protein
LNIRRLVSKKDLLPSAHKYTLREFLGPVVNGQINPGTTHGSEEDLLFYRRKFYIVKSDFVDAFNDHFNKTNLPNQLKHGARLVGRWLKPNDDDTTEIFAIWEYDSYEDYEKIEASVRSDEPHKHRIRDWYEKFGGRERVYTEYILEVRNEAIKSTVVQ